MRKRCTVLAAILWVVVPDLVAAQESVPDEGADIVAAARAEWTRRTEASLVARRGGYEVAEQRVRGGISALEFGAAPGVPLHSSAGYEHVVSAGLVAEVGGAARRTQEALAAYRDELDAEWIAEREVFVSAVVDAWLEWSMHSAVAEHLREDVGAYSELMRRFEDAAAARHISLLDLEDLRADLAALQIDLIDVIQERERAFLTLRNLVGTGIEPVPADFDALATPGASPWLGLSDRAAAHPALAALETRRARLSGEARAADASPTTINVGPALHLLDSGGSWLGLEATVTLPTRSRDPGAAATLRAESDAVAAEATVALEALRVRLDAEHDRYLALVDALSGLDGLCIRPLRNRLEMADAALVSGSETVERRIRAARDLHEAEHRRIRLVADIYRSRVHADIVRNSLEDS